VLLWPDTFNNYFHPETAKAAVEVLEAAGFHVIVPTANLCCGRPLYDHGMLDRAQSLLLQILDELSPEIEAGIPIVASNPAASPSFAMNSSTSFPTTNGPRPYRARLSCSASSSKPTLRTFLCRLSTAKPAKRSSTVTATTNPS